MKPTKKAVVTPQANTGRVAPKVAQPDPEPEEQEVQPTEDGDSYDWSSTGVTGMESMKSEDLGIPFLQIVQKGSPEVDKSHKDYQTKRIAGVEVGHIINSVTRQIIGGEEPVIFVPCYYQRAFVEWKARDTGGGYIRQHPSDAILAQCTRGEDNRDYLPNGNVIVTTAYFFGLHVTEEGVTQCVISMTSTELKKARMWLNMATQLKLQGPNGKFTPPLFSHSYALTTTPENNAKGSWMGWHIELHSQLTNRLVIDKAVESAKLMASNKRPLLSAPSSAADVPM